MGLTVYQALAGAPGRQERAPPARTTSARARAAIRAAPSPPTCAACPTL